MKRLCPLVALFSVLTIVAFPPGSNARTAVGSLEGTVIDAQGKLIAGATVTIQTSDGRHPHATHTNGRGRFAFSHFATGQYDVRAYASGSYSEWTKRVSIRPHTSTQVTLQIAVSTP